MSERITLFQWWQWRSGPKKWLLNCAFINLQNIFGENPADYAYGSIHSWFAEDGIHPDPATGGYLIKDAVFRALTNR
ncbi:hypothetical protein Q8726_21790 [Raoultella ornithinolytica]|jgi:hypothetical protein|uniref:SGNH hydrolase-type esterase domain-containing protein n=1 Tax=Raoultella ornithinolytica TaxID=54291 RepID=A0ABZ2DR53_RAOOR|nr:MULTISPECIES: hypothetical protein [Raoultella]KDV94658.1 hypothetical protein AB00_1778 [Raoultella ornithinolytica 2-156-04_S1_C1]KDX14788.1 hypothetical protein AB28_1972 [Raoultella ornithinolytica 2-156-04_S1_C2]MCT4739663.1 hypothetical protein [Raoultella ornithinolytica]MCW9581466.1 hypothetical protein [Raoultella ornithinolytica]MCZ0103814.1 hypothetical protein [Raoultella ornithinolytica]